MKRVACLVFLTLLLSLTGVTSVRAEEPLPPKLQQLTEEAYRHYSARETDNYFEAIEKV